MTRVSYRDGFDRTIELKYTEVGNLLIDIYSQEILPVGASDLVERVLDELKYTLVDFDESECLKEKGNDSRE